MPRASPAPNLTTQEDIGNMEGKLLEHMAYVRQVAQTSAAVCELSGGRRLTVPLGLGRLQRIERPVSNEEATVCLLVLQDALEPQQQQHSPALDQLQRALFGVQHELTFMELVYSSTFERARLAAAACAALLRTAALSPATCFALLRLADEAAVPCLRRAAMQVALQEFSAAHCWGWSDFKALPAHLLEEVLAHDDLAVPSEMAVFQGLAHWVAAAPADRRSCFADLLGACVRLDALSLDELALMDDHPLVRACMRATSMVARAYLNGMQAHLGGVGSAPHSGARRGPGRRGRRGAPLEKPSGGSAQSGVPSGCGLLAAHRAAVLALRAAEEQRALVEERLHGEHAAASSMADAQGVSDATPAGAAGAGNGGHQGLGEEPPSAQQRGGSLPVEMLASPARRTAVQAVQAVEPSEGSSQRTATAGVRRRLRLE